MRVEELSVVVDLAREVGVIFLRRFEDNLPRGVSVIRPHRRAAEPHLGAIRELV